MILLPFAIAALLMLYIQSLLGRVAPMAPDLSPVLAAYLGLFVRRDLVPLGAALLGLLRAGLDPEPLGALILIHLTISLFALLVRDFVYVNRLSTQLVVAFAASAFYVGLRAFSEVLFGGDGGHGNIFRYTVVSVLGTLVAPFVFAALRTLRVGPFER